tara:strand:+ start:658 stop:1506 length:849 start_codon:yes stop_codon:yes gene_type:complete
MYKDIYKIQGTTNLDNHLCFRDENTYPNFQNHLQNFRTHIKRLVDNKESATFYKFGDGDGRFLSKDPIGSAAPGARALSKSYDDIEHEKFTTGAQKCDYYTCEIYPENRKMFKSVIDREIDYPAEYVYGLIANKWFFETFAGRIGLLGASEKLNVIQELMQHKEYQEYLGLESFSDYIHFPQKYAADDIELVETFIGEQLKDSKSDIFLLGIGHAKSGLLHTFTKYKKAIYLDVGAGIDMIAGCINIKRPFAGEWVNYRLENYDYSNVDYLRYHGEGIHRTL